MNTASKNSRYLSIALVGVAALLAGVLYWEWTQGLRLEQDLAKLRKVPVTPVVVKPLLPEFNLPDVEAGFPELIARSLFATNRRSSASAYKGGKSAMKKGQFVLVGVLVTPAQKSALLRDVQTNKTETVAQNGVVRGLTLGEVEPSRVVLRQGTESEELILNVQIGQRGPASLPPATSGMPAPAPAPAMPKPPVLPSSAASAASAPVYATSSPTPVPGGAPKPVEVASAPRNPQPARADGNR